MRDMRTRITRTTLLSRIICYFMNISFQPKKKKCPSYPEHVNDGIHTDTCVSNNLIILHIAIRCR